MTTNSKTTDRKKDRPQDTRGRNTTDAAHDPNDGRLTW
jgi:hypothetical protein